MQNPLSAPLSGRDLATSFLREHVLSDPAMQGQFINEQDIADRVGVSRTPVREAMLLLSAEGLVEMIPKRGAQIPIITGRQISEVMELRGILERSATTLAMERGAAPAQAMRAVLDEQRSLVHSEPEATGKTFIAHDRTFHELLVDAAGNELLSETYSKLRTRLVLIGVEALFRTPHRQESVCTEHENIVAAIEANDISAAIAATDHHLAVTLDVLLRGA
ncbi:GntR family transcriptional regulator [Lysinibacter cavernae]|uniref:DNA-binding GntR family transcriptional regulator n=1 Tax=Lysinibacter cavernae TaxID=1640652 RepID=A0A7X5QZA5_9MICO|nr:GntR family transcriptional regulator [Lysinibacter cavernae]NIH52714.1 DNA-binding GntR family transcriptional regulator [Lysinibacter cavernae]